MEKITLSVVVITKNESHQIADCLETAKWADEIVVVDDESTDNTREIASEYTDKVMLRKMDNEGRHRNWAYSQASNEWVLSLDADERITPELREEISELFKRGPEKKAYTIPLRTHIGKYWLRYGGEYPASKLRLFVKDEFKYREEKVHPGVLCGPPAGQLKGDIVHYSHRDIADYLSSVNNHTTLEAQKWLNSGKGKSLGHAVWSFFERCFYKRLLRKKAYKDGFRGVAVAFFSGAYQIITYFKYRELVEQNSQDNLKK